MYSPDRFANAEAHRIVYDRFGRLRRDVIMSSLRHAEMNGGCDGLPGRYRGAIKARIPAYASLAAMHLKKNGLMDRGSVSIPATIKSDIYERILEDFLDRTVVRSLEGEAAKDMMCALEIEDDDAVVCLVHNYLVQKDMGLFERFYARAYMISIGMTEESMSGVSAEFSRIRAAKVSGPSASSSPR